MAEPKTRPTGASVDAFLKTVEDDQKRADSLALVKLMKQATRAEPKMWGPSIIGFGTYRLGYADGTEADWPIAAFSPREKELTVYLMGVFDRHPELMKKLGKYRTGKVCLYIKRLADVDMKVLKELIAASVRYMREKYR